MSILPELITHHNTIAESNGYRVVPNTPLHRCDNTVRVVQGEVVTGPPCNGVLANLYAHQNGSNGLWGLCPECGSVPCVRES